MTRRLILAALAMLAVLSLESCGISRINGLDKNRDNGKKIVQVQPAPSGGAVDQGQDEQPVDGRH